MNIGEIILPYAEWEEMGERAEKAEAIVQEQADNMVILCRNLDDLTDRAEKAEAALTELQATADMRADQIMSLRTGLAEERLRSEKAEAEVARLTELTAVCTCISTSGPDADCPVCGAVRAFADLRAVLAQLRRLHVRYRGVPDFDTCQECNVGDQWVAWPCNTIRVLDGAPDA